MIFKRVPRTVFVLGLVSFFNDVASEMIYPIVPIFLTTVLHASIPVIGFIEGFAESVASITKYLFGTYSDYLKKRKIFVVLGYSFGSVSKLLIGLSFAWPFVLFARVIDRLGKGLRTAPRDSLLLENATPVYETMPGWQSPIDHIRRFKHLPVNARKYLKRLDALLDTRVTIVSVGSARSQTIFV